MTIDRVLTAAAPRTEKGGTPLAQLPAAEGDSGANPAGKSAFSSVLGAMTDEATDVSAPADIAPTVVANPALAPVVPAPELQPALDAAAVLAQLAGSFRPDAATLAQGPASAEPAADLPGAEPGTVMTSATGVRLQGVGAMLPDPADVALGQTSDLEAESTPVVSSLAPRQLPAGPQNAPSVAALSDASSGRAGEGQRAAQEVEDMIRADWRAATAGVAERAVLTSSTWSDSAVGGFRPFPSSRGSDRAGARSLFLPLDASAPGSVTSSSYAAPLASGATPLTGADAPMAPGASSDVAHKVHYWVTRGVQTAELQLDALGGSAVDVSISLQGKEALVEFRSDQPEARRLLQDAMPQLRDMLRAEGLQLAGGFVGSSAQQKEGDARGESQHRASERMGTVSVSAADAVRTGRAGSGSTHALDVFV